MGEIRLAEPPWGMRTAWGLPCGIAGKAHVWSLSLVFESSLSVVECDSQKGQPRRQRHRCFEEVMKPAV